MQDYGICSKFETDPRLHKIIHMIWTCNTVRKRVFFPSLLLWDLAQPKIYKFQIRALVVKLATIVVKRCWEGCVHQFTSHLIRLFELLAVLFGKYHALAAPPLYSMLAARKVTIFFLENPTLIRRRGVISKEKLPSQHFCPRLSENNCKQFLAYNKKCTEDMQLLFSIITGRWIIFIVVVFGHHSQNMEHATSTYVLFRRRVFLDAILRYNSILGTGSTMGIESPFFVKFPFCFMKFTN